MTKSQKTDMALPQSSSLPDGWHTVRFGDVANKISDIVDRKNCDLDHFVAGEHMQTDDFRIKDWGTIDEGYLGPAFNHKFIKGQILYGSRRTYLRKVSIPHFDGVCANTTFVIEPTGDDLIPELLPFVMQSAGFNEQSIRMSKGSTNPYINWKDIACYEFAVPEKEQQQRIATTLWAAEDCIVKAERFVAAAEEAKQVLMRELFSKGIGHNEFKNVIGLGKIPAIWNCDLLDQLVQQVSVGIVQKPASYYVENGIPTLRSLNIQENRIIPEDMVYISPKDNDTVLSKSKLRKGDVLVVRTGYPGTSCVVPNEYEGKNCIDLIIVRTGVRLFNEYLSRYLNSPEGKQQIFSRSAGLAQQHLNIAEIKKLLIPYGSLEEQRQIAAILTRCDETIAAARANVIAAKALKMKMINEMLGDEAQNR